MDDAMPASGHDSVATKPGNIEGSTSHFGSATHEKDSSDEELIVAFARGATDAFGELFSSYKQPLFGFFWRRVADRALAEELAQESFVAVIRAAPSYEPSARFRTYLYAIALKILQAYRRKAAFRATFIGTQAEHFEPAAKAGLDEQFQVREALRKLDGGEREILLLREFEQLSYEEIAELMKLPLNTVRSRLYRARLALRELLTERAPTHAGEFRAQEEGI